MTIHRQPRGLRRAKLKVRAKAARRPSPSTASPSRAPRSRARRRTIRRRSRSRPGSRRRARSSCASCCCRRRGGSASWPSRWRMPKDAARPTRRRMRALVEREVVAPRPTTRPVRRYYDNNRAALPLARSLRGRAHPVRRARRCRRRVPRRAPRPSDIIAARGGPQRFCGAGGAAFGLPVGRGRRSSRPDWSWSDGAGVRGGAAVSACWARRARAGRNALRLPCRAGGAPHGRW